MIHFVLKERAFLFWQTRVCHVGGGNTSCSCSHSVCAFRGQSVRMDISIPKDPVLASEGHYSSSVGTANCASWQHNILALLTIHLEMKSFGPISFPTFYVETRSWIFTLMFLFICQCLQGLDFLHFNHVIHQDARSFNILRMDGPVKPVRSGSWSGAAFPGCGVGLLLTGCQLPQNDTCASALTTAASWECSSLDTEKCRKVKGVGGDFNFGEFLPKRGITIQSFKWIKATAWNFGDF